MNPTEAKHRANDSLSALTTETTGKCEVLRLAKESSHECHKMRSTEHGRHIHCHTLGVDRGQVGVLEERHEVGLSGLLESHNGRGLKAQIGLERGDRQHPTTSGGRG